MILSWKDMEGAKCIWLTERSQFQKTSYYMIPTIWYSGKDKAMEMIERSVVVSTVGEGRDEQAEHENIKGSENILCDTK